MTLLFWYLFATINIIVLWMFRMWHRDYYTLQYYYYKREYKQLSDIASDNESLAA